MTVIRRNAKIGEGVTIQHYVNLYDCEIGDGTKIGSFAEIGGSKVGRRCKIGAFAFIPPGVTIEDEVFIGPHVVFTNDKHPRAVGPWKIEPVLVKTGASIGANTTVLPGVTIGKGAMVGAGAVVTRDILEMETVMGVPAR